MLYGGYLSGVFLAIDKGMPAGVVALMLLTAFLSASMVAERQWAGLVPGFGGVALVVSDKLGLTGVSAAGRAFRLSPLAVAGMAIVAAGVALAIHPPSSPAHIDWAAEGRKE